VPETMSRRAERGVIALMRRWLHRKRALGALDNDMADRVTADRRCVRSQVTFSQNPAVAFAVAASAG
jgi:hypothetical protein